MAAFETRDPAGRAFVAMPASSCPAKLAELVAGIGAAIDAMDGRFTMRCTTVALTAARADAD